MKYVPQKNIFLEIHATAFFKKLSFKNFSLMSLHAFFKSLTIIKKALRVILFIQNVVLRANYTLNYAFNWFSFTRK
jgi:hypothetical protein